MSLSRLAAALRREPVRAYLYGLLIPGAALAVAYGVMAADKAALWVALGGVALVPGATELARRKTVPLDSVVPPENIAAARDPKTGAIVAGLAAPGVASRAPGSTNVGDVVDVTKADPLL